MDVYRGAHDMARKKIILGLFIAFLIVAQLLASEIPEQFISYTTEDGLPHNTVRAIAQDSVGFMYFGTQDGLVRFDGNKVQTFRHDHHHPYTLSNNFITSLYVGRSNKLWIGTRDGFNQFDLITEKIIPFRNDSTDPFSLGNNSIHSVYEDTSGIVWIATSGGGLNRFDPRMGTFIRYQRDPTDPHSIGFNYISCITEDDTGILWLGTTGKGIIRFNRITDTFTTYEFQPGIAESFRSNVVRSITQDASGLLWIGTYGGFHLFDPERGYIRHWTQAEIPGNSLSENSVWSIKEDSDQMLWIATFGGGMNRFDPKTEEFKHWLCNDDKKDAISSNSLFTLFFDNVGTLWIGTANGISKINDARKQIATYAHNPRNPNTLAASMVSAIFEDSSGIVWVGAGGLNKLDRELNTVTRYMAKPDDRSQLSHSRITTIHQDATGMLLVGTEGGGLNLFDPYRQTFRQFRQEIQDQRKLSHDAIWTSCIDRYGNLWIGTAGGGLNKFEGSSETFTRWLADIGDAHALTNNFITSIIEDRDAFLWVGTDGGGVHRFDPQTGIFTRYQSKQENQTGISSNFISVLFQDSRGILWVGTSGGGLNKCIAGDPIQPDRMSCFAYDEKSGFPSDVIQGILEDNRGNLWISTNRGIVVLNPHDNSFRTYDRFDGLQGNEFERGSCFKNTNGELMFGGFNGMNVFHPENISDNLVPPPIVITGLRFLNNPVVIGENSMLQKVPWATDVVTMPYDRSMVTFEFAALDYRFPRKNQYAYKLDGFNEDWIYCGNERTATFTNLNPGTYTFRVKGSNNDGIWNQEGTTMKLVILPPYWKTWWFQAVLLMSVAGFLAFLFYSRIEHYKKARSQQQEFSKRLIQSQELERKRIAAELHDGLAQNLLLINYEIIKHIPSENPESSSLNNALTYLKESVNEVREIAYNLHPHQLDRLGLTKALESAAQRVAHASGMKLNMHLENIDTHIPTDNQIHVYRIIQEVFTNIVKHAEASKCDFSIRIEGKVIQIRLVDNGKGFIYSKSKQTMSGTKGFGLSDIEERAKLIGGTLHIDTALQRGTLFECSIQL
jgi:two-component system, sensor histidine kinase ChiS